MNKTTCLSITFQPRRPCKISTDVQRALEDAFKTRKLFSSIFSKFGRGPQQFNSGKIKPNKTYINIQYYNACLQAGSHYDYSFFEGGSYEVNHPAQERLATPPGSASPVDKLLSEKTQIHFKNCVFAPLPTHNKINCNDETVNSRMFPYKTYSAIQISLLRFSIILEFAFPF